MMRGRPYAVAEPGGRGFFACQFENSKILTELPFRGPWPPSPLKNSWIRPWYVLYIFFLGGGGAIDGSLIFRSWHYRDWLDQLLPSREVRGSKRCGKMRHCWGVCCGGMRCCKKGWSCRYMNNIRIYTCIPWSQHVALRAAHDIDVM